MSNTRQGVCILRDPGVFLALRIPFGSHGSALRQTLYTYSFSERKNVIVLTWTGIKIELAQRRRNGPSGVSTKA